MMESVLQGLNGKICFVYLDNIIVFGSIQEEHNDNLIKFFNRLREVGLKLQPDKCKYLRPEIDF